MAETRNELALAYDHIVREVASRYRSRVRWASREDLEQAGRIAFLEAIPNYDPAVGVSIEGYLRGVAYHAMRRALWAESSPVSGGWHRPEETRTQRRAAFEDRNHTTDAPSQERALDEAKWRERVRARLAEIAPCPEVAPVLLEQVQLSDAASGLGVSTTWMRHLTAEARNRVETDHVLFDLIVDRR